MLQDIFRIDKIFDVCSKICYFLLVDLLFILSNIPVLLFLLFVGADQVHTYLPLFFLCLLPAAPAFCGVLYAMRRVLEGRETKAGRDYLRGVRMDFGQKFTLGAMQLLYLFIMVTNIEFFSMQVPCLPIIIAGSVLFVLGILITPNLYVLITRYQMRNHEVIKAAVILTLARPLCTIGYAAALGSVLMLFELVAGTAVLFMFSIYGFLIVLLSRGIGDKKSQ